MSKRFPTRVVIGHLEYTIKEDEQKNLGDKDGECDFERLEIRTSKDLIDPLRTETVLHELLHAVFHQYGLDDQSTEEDFATRGAKGILALIKQNSDVLDMLIEFSTGITR